MLLRARADEENLHEEHRRRIREDLEKANKVIADGVATAKETGSLGVQVVIRPVKRTFAQKVQSEESRNLLGVLRVHVAISQILLI